jgi:zinc protease
VREAQTPLLAMARTRAPRRTGFRASEVLLAIPGSGDSSRLHQRMVEKEQAAVQVGTSLDRGFDPGPAWIYAVIPPGGDPVRAEKIVDEEIARIAKDGPTPAELTKARNQPWPGSGTDSRPSAASAGARASRC